MPSHAVMLLAAHYVAYAPAPPPKLDKSEAAVKKEWGAAQRHLDGRQCRGGRQGTVLRPGQLDPHGGQVHHLAGVRGRGGKDRQGRPDDHPKSLDLRASTGVNKGKLYRAIYEVSRDTFRVCFGPPDQPRPKRFESTGDRKDILATIKGAKP